MTILAICAASLVSAIAGADNVSLVGQPRAVELSRERTAYQIEEGGLTIDVSGKRNILLELRSRTKGKGVVLDILREDNFQSHNLLQMRRVGSGPKGYSFVSLVAFATDTGTHRYRLIVTGGDLIVRVTETAKLMAPFRAQPWVDSKPPETPAVTQQVEPPPDPPPEITGTTTPDGDMTFDIGTEIAAAGGGTVTPTQTSDVKERLTAADDALAIGGLLYPRFRYGFRDNERISDAPLFNDNLADIYLDARPADQLRGFVRMRLNNSNIVPPAGSPFSDSNVFTLDQLWIKWTIERRVYVTLGKQPLRWGVGRFWNPADRLNRQRRDPLAAFDARNGIKILKVHYPIESLGWNLYAIADFDGISSAADMRGAARAEIVMGPAELSLSATARRKRPMTFSAELDSGLGPLDIKGEFVVSKGLEQQQYFGELDQANDIFPTLSTQANRTFMQALGGLELKIHYAVGGDRAAEDEITFGAEYFYNERGYESLEIAPFLAARNELVDYDYGRHYAGAYIIVPQPARWDDTLFILTGIADLTYGSRLLRLDYRVQLMTYAELDTALTWRSGDGILRSNFPVLPLPGQASPATAPRRANDWELFVGLQLPL